MYTAAIVFLICQEFEMAVTALILALIMFYILEDTPDDAWFENHTLDFICKILITLTLIFRFNNLRNN